MTALMFCVELDPLDNLEEGLRYQQREGEARQNDDFFLNPSQFVPKIETK